MTENTNNKQILKSTSIIGGSSVLNILFKIIQSKAVALLLGPEGIGLIGLFNSVSGLAVTLAGMGLGTSGVRAIASAADNEESKYLADTVLAFRRITLVLGSLGMLSVFILRKWISQITFGSAEYAAAIGWLSLAVFFLVVSSSQTTLIRGVRRIADLARVSVLGVAIGTLLGIPLIYWWGTQGVVFYLLGVAGTTILVSWWYARKIPLAPTALSWRATLTQARALLSFGSTFMITGLTTMATTYGIRVMITRQLSLDAAGLVQAASAMSMVYVGFVLGAMGADFFPHLSGLSSDNAATNQLINAQVRIGTLLAVPGILAVLALGSWILTLLYSAEFTAAFDILRWQVLGTFLRVVSWPLAFLMLARGKGIIFFFTEVSTNLIYLRLAWLGMGRFGLPGVGIAFFGMYIFYTILVYFSARHLSGFRWSHHNLRLGLWVFPSIAMGFSFSYISSPMLSLTLGLALTLVVGVFSLRSLIALVGTSTIRSYWERIAQRLKWMRV